MALWSLSLVVPRHAFSRTLEPWVQTAATQVEEGADCDSVSGEMSDEGEEAALGARFDLPDSVTKSSSRLTSKQRLANLNADRQVVERALTIELKSSTAEQSTHFANPVHCIHARETTGNRKVTEAIMIVPTSDDFIGLEQSDALCHSAFVDVEIARSFVVASRKEAARARRAMMDGWSFDSNMTSCKLRNTSLFQGQIGQKIVETILKDFAKSSDR